MYEDRADCYCSQLLDLTFHDQEPQKAMLLLGKMRETEKRKGRAERGEKEEKEGQGIFLTAFS